jgi:MEDS: MEthanogen/methylotroph, DcmR Sensory domain
VEDRSERVLVYRHDAQLVEAGGSFLSDALSGGGAAIAFASAGHLRALEDWVSLCGSDLSAAAEERRYYGLEVEAVLGSLDSPENAAAVISRELVAALAEVPADVGPVHVFGEVAPALREAPDQTGNVSFAALANVLRAARRVSLLCARREDLPADETCARQAAPNGTELIEAPAFPAPRTENGAVVSSAVLPPAPAACRAARRLVRAACTSEAGADAIDTAELVVSELAGNAVRHARSTFRTEISFRNGAVRLAVTDARPLPDDWDGFPIAREHGLGLVAAVAQDWAVEPLAGGKVVWAELARNREVR